MAMLQPERTKGTYYCTIMSMLQSPSVQTVSTSTTIAEKSSSAASCNSSSRNRQNTEESGSTLPRMINAPWTKPLVHLLTCLVWPGMLTLPAVLNSNYLPYQTAFPESWYKDSFDSQTFSWPSPLGLSLGIAAVAVGQFFVVSLFYLYRLYGQATTIQAKGARAYFFSEGLATHFANPEGFVMLGLYLCLTWMLRLMPASYYSFEGGISLRDTFVCLLLQDGFQYAMHRLEHSFSAYLYIISHKPHHRFTNPRMFDAFNGSPADTFLMILIPLFMTAQCVRTCNVWSYMAFGSLYAGWLTMLHSEFILPWDALFSKLGFGTPADHHVHHKLYKYNYGHLFMWYDMLGGTYKDPKQLVPKLFNAGV